MLINIVTLRPRSFIPYGNKEVYSSFFEWAKWYWNGAVHINDVASAVLQSIDLLNERSLHQHLVLPIDGAYEYTLNDLQEWDQSGPGATFKKYYAKYFDLAIPYGLNPNAKPTIQGISDTKKWLPYQPRYSLMSLLEGLSKYGEAGPPSIKFD